MTEYDSAGNETLTMQGDEIANQYHYTVMQPVLDLKSMWGHQILRFAYWDPSVLKPRAPMEVTVYNSAGKITQTFTADPDTPVSFNGQPIATPTQANYLTWTRHEFRDRDGQLQKVHRYHRIPPNGPGSPVANFYTTLYGYDTSGRRSITAELVRENVEQVTRTFFDVLDRPTVVQRAVSLSTHAILVPPIGQRHATGVDGQCQRNGIR